MFNIEFVLFCLILNKEFIEMFGVFLVFINYNYILCFIGILYINFM